MIAKRIKNVFSSFILPDKRVYLENILTSAGSRLISDVLEVKNISKLKGFIQPVDIEKAFDLVIYLFNILLVKQIWILEEFYKMNKNSFYKSRILYN